jgi:hypothetical protein
MALTNDAFGEKEAGRVAEAYLAKFGSRPDIIHAHGDGASLVTRGP